MNLGIFYRTIVPTLAILCFAHLQAEPTPPEPPPLALPKPKPAQVASSEAMLPLPPLPIANMKRQEKKNPPQPPVLLTKIKSQDDEDWTRTPNDVKGLLEWISAQMNVHFSSNIKSFSQISVDPAQNPILYRSGYKAFRLTPKEVEKCREYVAKGGTIIFNSLVGNPDAYKSALQAAHDILPEQPLYRIRLDHPVFHSFYEIDKVGFRERMVKDGLVSDPHPWLEGVDIDNRTAIFISKWDFSLGWEANAHDSWGYSDADACKLGANIVSYVTAMRDAGKSIGKSVELVNADSKTASKFRVGLVEHGGPWKTRPAAFPMLLNQFQSVTGTPVSFELRDVSLQDPAIFEMPFLYITGTTDFSLTETERANLRRYLSNGGVLFAEAGEGRSSFDNSFRTEMEAVLPGSKLNLLGPTHPIFNQPSKLVAMKARPSLAAKFNNQSQLPPELYGVDLNGSLSVIYCPHDLSTGWERAIAPYAQGYQTADSTALGLNVLYYAVTH